MALKLHFASLFRCVRQQQTGNLSVFDILEDIRTPQVPIQLQSLVAALTLEKTEKEEFNGKMVIHLLTPDGRQAMVGAGEMKIPVKQGQE